MKREFSGQFFLEKYSTISFYENPISGSRAIPCWQTNERTDRHDEASSRSSKFREVA